MPFYLPTTAFIVFYVSLHTYEGWCVSFADQQLPASLTSLRLQSVRCVWRVPQVSTDAPQHNLSNMLSFSVSISKEYEETRKFANNLIDLPLHVCQSIITEVYYPCPTYPLNKMKWLWLWIWPFTTCSGYYNMHFVTFFCNITILQTVQFQTFRIGWIVITQ